MRTKKAFINVITAISGQMIGQLASFIGRIAFTHYMSQNYLGLNGLFTNILTVLSFVELGVGPAITFALYKPLSENDTETVSSLMMTFKKAYRLIGIIILVLGFAFTPFYPFFIKDTSGVENLTIIYWLYILNTGISYFYSYKISLLIADQQQYVKNIGHYAFFVGLNIVQILILVFTQNYLMFLSAQVIFTFIENFVLSKIADKRYPYLKNKKVKPLSKELKQPIIRNIKAMICHKFGGIVVNSTDNLLISKFLGLAITGIYSNYALVVNSIRGLLSRVFEAIVASVGNLNAEENNSEKIFDVYQKIFFINFWLFGFCAICLGCLLQPFIKLFFGNNYLLDNFTVIIIILNFYIYGMRQAPNVLRSAAGLYYKDWFKPIIESVINLVSSIILLKYFGVAGIFMGTILSTLLGNAWIEAYVVYKNVLHKPLRVYFRDYIKYFILFMLGFVLTASGCYFIKISGIWGLIIKLLACIIISNGFFALTTFKTKEFKYFLDLTKKVFSSVVRKLKRK